MAHSFTRQVPLQQRTRLISVQTKTLQKLISLLDAHYTPANQGTLSIVFLPHQVLAQMHADFCNDPSPTDIITFPSDHHDTENFGELCISPQAALEFLKKHSGTLESELRRYVIHGYLHLLGYDDLNPKARQEMRRQERRCLQLCSRLPKIFTLRQSAKPTCRTRAK